MFVVYIQNCTYFRAKVTRIVPLKNMEFTTILKGSELKDIKHKVAKYGGTLVSKCTENIAAVFAIQGNFNIRLSQFGFLPSYYLFE